MNTIPDVSPGGCCELHETQDEFDADVRAIARFRERFGLAAYPSPRRFVLICGGRG
jgi:hypothetical protein